MSRAAWLAVASSVAAFEALGAGCSNASPTGPDDADVAVADAPSERDLACAVFDAGRFACGATSCLLETSFCRRETGFTCLPGHPYPQASPYDRSSCESRTNPYLFPRECRDCPTCECVLAHTPDVDTQTKVTCQPIPDGGIVVTTTNTPICGACYGAPPARLERIAAVSATPCSECST